MMFDHAKLTASIIFSISLTALIDKCNVQASDCDKNDHLTAEHKLKEKLLCHYDPTIRPVKDRNQQLAVNVQFDIRHIDFDEKHNLLYVQVMLGMLWKDAFLIWDSEDESNITHLFLPAKDVWVPDLTIYNNWESWGELISLENQKVFSISSGTVGYINVIEVSSHCSLDVTHWPYDVNTCGARMSSRSYFSDVLEFKLMTNLSFTMGKNFYRSNIWEVIGVGANVKETFHGMTNSSYRIATIHLDVTIARESASLFSTVATPIIVIVFTLMTTFWLEPFEMYRTLLGVASMIGHIAYLLYLGEVVPSNGDKPVLIVSLVRNSLFLCWCSLALHAYERAMCHSNNRIPIWMWNISAWLRRYGIERIFLIPRENESAQETGEKTLEWLQIAVIIDRLCFMIYFLIYLVMLFEFSYYLRK